MNTYPEKTNPDVDDILLLETDSPETRRITYENLVPKTLRASMALRTVAGGFVNAITLTTGVNFTTLPIGFKFRFMPTNNNTGPTTLDLDGIGPLPCQTVTGAALPPDYIRANVETVATFEGTYIRLNREVETLESASKGTCVRYEDGWQECEHSFNLGSIIENGAGTFDDPYRTNTFSWTFEQPFIDVPRSVATPVFNVSGAPDRAIIARLGQNSTTDIIGISAFRISSANSDIDIEVNIRSRGKWYLP
jgi:hypothetical protein